MAFAPIPASHPNVTAGKLRALAVTSTTRSSLLPDVPTMAEAGLPGFDASLYYGLVAPAGTPRPIIDRLNKALREALASDEVKKQLGTDGTEITPGTPEDYAEFIDKDEKKWSQLAQGQRRRAGVGGSPPAPTRREGKESRRFGADLRGAACYNGAMRPQLIRLGSGLVALALLRARRRPSRPSRCPPSTADAMAQAASPQAIAEYRRKLGEYQDARAAFEEEAGRLLGLDHRETARPQRQAARSPADHARRLRADPAAALYRAEAAGQSGAGPEESRAARAQGDPRRRRSVAGRGRGVPVHAAAPGERSRVQARLCPLRAGLGPDARAGGAGLFVRDRRHRQLRRAVGHRAWRQARHLHRDGLQPAAHHQQRRTDGRAGPRVRQGTDGEGGDIVGAGAQGDGPQARGAEEDGGVHAHRAGRLVGARKARQYRRRAGRCTPWCWTSTSGRCCRPTSC